MAEIFRMPQASPTMEAGTLLSWRVAEGSALAPQDVIAEVETDKATMEIEVFDEGFFLKRLVDEGAEVPAGGPIAIIGATADEDISALIASAAAESTALGAPAPVTAAPAPTAPARAPAPSAVTKPPLKAGLRPAQWRGQDLAPAIMEVPEFHVATARVRAAPAARHAAQKLGVNLETVSGTGPRGRVLRKDVEAAAQAPEQPSAEAAPATLVRNSQMRKTIARRLTAASQEAPAFFLTAVLDCDALVPFRGQLKAAGVGVSYNDVIIAACARALRDVPEVNASWGEQAITRHSGVHIGVAVALDDGLITPVVRDADTLGLATINAQVRELAGRAKAMKLAPHEYTGSTFTISNLGMMGIEQFTAILNPPEALILAVGGMQQEPVVGPDGGLTVGWRMRVTLTCDHRVVDGALGARFLAAVRRYIQSPALLAT